MDEQTADMVADMVIAIEELKQRPVEELARRVVLLEGMEQLLLKRISKLKARIAELEVNEDD